MPYVTFIEHNEWEGEDWHFHIPLEGNEEAVRALRDHLEDDDELAETFEVLDGKPLTDTEVDTLVDHGGSGYMDFHNKLEGLLDADSLLDLEGSELFDALNKGGIRNYVD